MSMRVMVVAAVFSSGCTDKVKDVLPKLAPQFEPWRTKLSEARDRCWDNVDFTPIEKLSPRLEATVAGGNAQFVRCKPNNQDTADLGLHSALEDWAHWTNPNASYVPLDVLEREYDAQQQAEVKAVLATRYLVLYGVDHFEEPSQRVPGGDVRWTVVLYDADQGKALTLWSMVSDVADRPGATVTDLRYQVHDGVLGLIASLPDTTVKLPSASGGELKPLHPKTGPAKPLPAAAKCRVVFPPGSEVEEARNLTCTDAELLAIKMREKGFTATVVKDE